MQQLKLFGLLLVIMAGFVPLQGVSVSYVGDVVVFVNETYWKCDKIDCSPETYYCRVTKEKPDPEGTQLKRYNGCYSDKNEPLLESTTYETIAATDNVSLNMTSYRTGVITTSSNIGGNAFYTGNNYNYITTSGNGGEFDQKQLDASLANVNRINADIEEYTRQVNEQIQLSMQTLRANLGNLFNNWR